MEGEDPDAGKVKVSPGAAYRVEGQVSSHVGGSDAVEHGGASQRAQTLGNDVEESPEQGHLGANQVGEGDSRVDVSSTDVADGLNEGGGRQPKAEGNVEDVVRPGGPTKGRPEPEKDKEHGAVKLGKHRPPERHGSELPHGGKKKGQRATSSENGGMENGTKRWMEKRFFPAGQLRQITGTPQTRSACLKLRSTTRKVLNMKSRPRVDATASVQILISVIKGSAVERRASL